MDEKTLSILGAPKEGFEWVEMPNGSLEIGDVGTYVVTRREGVIIEHYTQVPIEPEPEVIWEGNPGSSSIKRKIMLDGTVLFDSWNKWRVEDDEADLIATYKAAVTDQHKELKALKALKEKLGEIKAQADACVSPSGYRANVMSDLIDMCRALEVE